MNLIDRIFRRKTVPSKSESFALLDGYKPVYHTWGGAVYESELCRAAIDAKGRHISKLSPVILGTAKPSLKARLSDRPNDIQTWSQFLYKTATILNVKNTCFVTSLFDDGGNLTGFYSIAPESWSILRDQMTGQLWLRFVFKGMQTGAAPLEETGILTRYQYDSDFFGSSNDALNDTMNLLDIQRQGIEEAAKNSSTIRFIARASTLADHKDLIREQIRLGSLLRSKYSNGILLFPSNATDIRQVQQSAYQVDSRQLELIQNNVFTYYGVNQDILQNKAVGDAFSAFYEGEIEPFALQLSQVLTRIAYTERERVYGSEICFTASRVQYMTNKDKMDYVNSAIDRGLITIDEARDVWQLPPLPDGRGQIVIARGEYYDTATGEKIGGIMDADPSPKE